MQDDRDVLLSRNHTLSEELHRLQALMVAHHVEGKLSLHEETDCGTPFKDALFNVTITGVESTRF